MFLRLSLLLPTHLANANELVKAMSQLVDLGVRVLDVFTSMRTTPRLFKTLIDFTLAKFDKFFLVMVHTIVHYAQSTNDHHIEVSNLKFFFKDFDLGLDFKIWN